ncbi:MAG: FAD binding domain-containing protein [Gemmatimonadetes bacterium]|nr:FAD binding domain-containing protein [Gemmatimonadota bacterium]
MLRLPPFRYHRPRSVEEAATLLAEHPGDAVPVGGGTDLIPNMKHRLLTPSHLVALKGIAALRGVEERDGELHIGAAETLHALCVHPLVRRHFPTLADAAAHVAGPQLRRMGTIGGNLCLDTRCTYYNQTQFWRNALGFCLKKDGEVCHVTKVGKKCVAAHSADTPPVLMVLDAAVELTSAAGTRRVPVRDFFVADGIWNTVRCGDEIVTAVRTPLPGPDFRAAYLKLRQRNAIDFPLLTVAVGVRLDEGGRVREIRGAVTGLGAWPRWLTGWEELAEAGRLTPELIRELVERAYRQCHPLENIIVDADWRREMVRVYVRRALEQLAA